VISPKRLAPLDRQTVYQTVLSYYQRPSDTLTRRGDRAWCRAVAAYLARRWTDATLRELAKDLGLSRPDSVPNLTRRIEHELGRSTALQADLRTIEDLLREQAKTKNSG
jgi:chromosomal replication initiation ATPase DnaA